MITPRMFRYGVLCLALLVQNLALATTGPGCGAHPAPGSGPVTEQASAGTVPHHHHPAATVEQESAQTSGNSHSGCNCNKDCGGDCARHCASSPFASGLPLAAAWHAPSAWPERLDTASSPHVISPRTRPPTSR